MNITDLNPRYMTRISWRVNFVNRHKSSKASRNGLAGRVLGSNSNRTASSSIGLSGGVAMLFYSLFASLRYKIFFSTFVSNCFFFTSSPLSTVWSPYLIHLQAVLYCTRFFNCRLFSPFSVRVDMVFYTCSISRSKLNSFSLLTLAERVEYHFGTHQ